LAILILLKEGFKMKCKNCGNKEDFTMVREIGYWENKEKMFKDVDRVPEEYIICGICGSVKVDTEEDY